MSANPHRGEVALMLDGVSRILRPTFGAMVALESAMGCSIAELARAVFRDNGAQISADQVRSIVRACLVDGDAVDLEHMAPDGGFAAAAEACSCLLVAMITGGAPVRDAVATGEPKGRG